MSAVPTSDLENALLTGEDLLAMGDLGPCELIDGRIVPMTPTGGEHGYLELELAWRLKSFVHEGRLGWVLVGEVGIYTRRDPDRVRGADLAFYSLARLPARPGRKYLTVAPDLAVEIVSPGDSFAEVSQKISEYFSIGTGAVWVVLPEDRAVFVYRSETELTKLRGEDVLMGEGPLDGFELPLVELFG